MNFGNFCILVVYVCLSFAVLSSGRKTSPEEMFLKLIHSVVESNQGKVIFRFSEFVFWKRSLIKKTFKVQRWIKDCRFYEFGPYLKTTSFDSWREKTWNKRSLNIIVAAIKHKIATVNIARWNYLHTFWPVWFRPGPGPVRLKETVRMVEHVSILVVSVSFQLAKIQHQSAHGNMEHSVHAVNY